MPLLTTLQDNFNDNVIGGNWGNSYGGVTEVGGRARVPLAPGVYAGYQTGRSWTLAGASIFLKLVTRPAASTGTDVSANFLVTAATEGTSIGFKYNAVTAKLRLQSNVDYYDATAIEITYDPVAHLWLRLREDGTNIYWDTSPDGSTWTTRRTLATPAWVKTSIDTCALDLYGYRNAGVTDFAEYDNVNTLADGAVVNGAATLTSDSALTAAGAVALYAVADLSGDADLAAAPALSAGSAASLAASFELTVDAASTEIPEVAGLAAGSHDLLIEQGATFVQTYRILDDGFTWDGWSARAQIRSAPADSGALLLDLAPYLTVIGTDVRLAIPAAVTQTLTRNGVWDLEMYKGSTVVRLLQGKAIVSLEVTRT
ncbi:hypothetical protein ACFY2M_19245 [Streptomyces sp. NPDC001276]|uniref:hypothetical protein n=1 Tax=Streptomyces sp. NPDC001276 TaxID=3364555 RepID=UPI00369317C9